MPQNLLGPKEYLANIKQQHSENMHGVMERDMTGATMPPMTEEDSYGNVTPNTMNKFLMMNNMLKGGTPGSSSFMHPFNNPLSMYTHQPDQVDVGNSSLNSQASSPHEGSDQSELSFSDSDGNKKRFIRNLRVAIPEQPTNGMPLQHLSTVPFPM